jgi:hypothetical protein
MNDEVRILVPHDQITATESLIDDLAADLELPSGFVIAEGSPGIADHALLVRMMISLKSCSTIAHRSPTRPHASRVAIEPRSGNSPALRSF